MTYQIPAAKQIIYRCNFHIPSLTVTRPCLRAASMNAPSWSILRSYPGANFNILWIRSKLRVPRFVSIPSMNYHFYQYLVKGEEVKKRDIPSKRLASELLLVLLRTKLVVLRLRPLLEGDDWLTWYRYVIECFAAIPGLAALLEPSSAVFSSRYESLPSSFRTPRSIQVARALTIVVRSIDPLSCWESSSTDQWSIASIKT